MVWCKLKLIVRSKVVQYPLLKGEKKNASSHSHYIYHAVSPKRRQLQRRRRTFASRRGQSRQRNFYVICRFYCYTKSSVVLKDDVTKCYIADFVFGFVFNLSRGRCSRLVLLPSNRGIFFSLWTCHELKLTPELNVSWRKRSSSDIPVNLRLIFFSSSSKYLSWSVDSRSVLICYTTLEIMNTHTHTHFKMLCQCTTVKKN